MGALAVTVTVAPLLATVRMVRLRMNELVLLSRYAELGAFVVHLLYEGFETSVEPCSTLLVILR